MFNLYHLVTLIYQAAPVVALGYTIVLIRQTRSVKPLRVYLTLLVGSSLLGIGVVLLRESIFSKVASIGDVVMAGYWMTGLSWIVRALNTGSERVLIRLLRWRALAHTQNGSGFTGSVRHATRLTLLGTAALSRALIVFGLGAGLLLASVLGYRPGFAPIAANNPLTILQAKYETVTLVADDATRLSAWWIPAPSSAIPATRAVRQVVSRNDSGALAQVAEDGGAFVSANSRDTVLLCHGLGSDKSEQLPGVRGLYAAGYNVLAFDFRAHGQSGGSITTFGALERLDVLAAVRWLRKNQPEHARRVLGLGVNMGSAALLAAAADPSDDGQAIDAIAAIEPFDDAGPVMRELGDRLRLPALGWLASRVGLPVLHVEFGGVGASPADDVAMLWPRPLFVVQGGVDGLVPPGRARALFDDAMQPKYAWWVDRKSTRQILFADRRTSLALRVFFGGARSIL